MAKVYNKLIIDVRIETNDIITAVQNDSNSRFLDIFLKDNGLPIDLTGHEVRMYGIKGDTTEIYNNGTITEPTNGRCQFELTDQALAIAKDLKVQIVIYKDNLQILQSRTFTIHVVESLMSDSAIESSNEYGALVVLYQNLYKAHDLMTEMVQSIGEPEDIAKSLGLNTMFEVWDWLINYMSENSNISAIEKIEKIKTYTQNYTQANKEGFLSERLMYNTNLLEKNSADQLPAGFDGTFSRTAFSLSSPVGKFSTYAQVISKFVAPVSGVYKYQYYSHTAQSGTMDVSRVITNIEYFSSRNNSSTDYSGYYSDNTIYALFKLEIGGKIVYAKDLKEVISSDFLRSASDKRYTPRVLLSSFMSTDYGYDNIEHYFYAKKGELVVFVCKQNDNNETSYIKNQLITY